MLTLTDARGITFLTNEYDVVGRVSEPADTGGWGVAARVEAQWRHPWEASGTFVMNVSLTN
jgi:hypothetical protein